MPVQASSTPTRSNPSGGFLFPMNHPDDIHQQRLHDPRYQWKKFRKGGYLSRLRSMGLLDEDRILSHFQALKPKPLSTPPPTVRGAAHGSPATAAATRRVTCPKGQIEPRNPGGVDYSSPLTRSSVAAIPCRTLAQLRAARLPPAVIADHGYQPLPGPKTQSAAQ